MLDHAHLRLKRKSMITSHQTATGKLIPIKVFYTSLHARSAFTIADRELIINNAHDVIWKDDTNEINWSHHGIAEFVNQCQVELERSGHVKSDRNAQLLRLIDGLTETLALIDDCEAETHDVDDERFVSFELRSLQFERIPS